MNGSESASSASTQQRGRPEVTLPPDSHINSPAQLSSMSVVLVQKPCTADTTSSPERPDPDDAADDVTFVPTIPQTVKDLSKNN
jgi:hypothetical protein